MFPGGTPEMAKKTASVMALRQMYAMRLTAREISAALPILKEIRDAEKALASRASQALDEELRALLAADPESPPPPDSGMRMQQAMEQFNERQRSGWESLGRAIGPERAQMFQMLLSMGPGPGFGGPGFAPGRFGPPQPGGFPGAPRGPEGARPRLVPPTPAPLSPEAPEPAAPVLGLPALELGPPEPGGFAGGPAAPELFQQPPQPGFGPGPQGGRAGPFPGGQPGMPFFGPRLSLQDLIDLLEQKLAAMKK
jgi:hypothetical protein